MIEIKTLSTSDRDFWAQLEELLAWESVADASVESTVAGILGDVRTRGDSAVLEYTRRFDGLDVQGVEELVITAERLQAAAQGIPAEQRDALEAAAARIRVYHQRQKGESWSYTEADGTVLGQQVWAIDRVGLYVPGGKAAYPSSVLMNAIPAKVAGVGELIMTVPTPNGVVDELVLAAATVAGVDRVFAVGGAQAIAALAYGTESIPSVDKIVGPGNIYVAMAKRMVFGTVGIDMIAGPSEILVICDGHTDADWVAMDLFSQAEHDEDAQAILLSPDPDFLNHVRDRMDELLPQMERRDVIRSALRSRGALIAVNDLDEAVEVANRIAPEHLELSVDHPEALTPRIRHAGAIFMGRYTAEALGDYCAGPNHVLPTSGTARFSSPLGVYDFQKRSSLIMCSSDGASTLGRVASTLAQCEGFTAHSRSARYRFRSGS